MRSQLVSAILVGLGHGALALQADIRADTNRDGRVDIQGTSDVEGKQTWSDSKGAIFLTNIFEPSNRCSTVDENYPGYSSWPRLEKAGVCYANNATDDVQQSAEHMARILTVPIPDASDAALGFITVSEDAARNRVRIFRANGDEWDMVQPETVFHAEELRKGLSLGIDARDTRRPGVWDGRATVVFSVTDGEQESRDSVMLRVAPLLTHHHLQRIEDIYATKNTNTDAMAAFSAIEAITAEAGMKKPLQRIISKETWTQDIFETLYMSMPGPEGSVISKKFVFDVAKIREGHGAASGPVWEFFRSQGVAMAHDHWPSQGFGDSIMGTLESLGNLETIPPHSHNGKNFPAGRIVAGGTAGKRSEIPRHFDFFAAQESQEPLLLDTSWLFIRHVDEFVQFLPAQTERGWRLLVNDPLLGIQLLKDIESNGSSKPIVANHPKVVTKRTVDSFLEKDFNHWVAGNASARIQGVVDVLKAETGISDEEILRVPVLYSRLPFIQSDISPPRGWKRSNIARRQAMEQLPSPWEAANPDLPNGQQEMAQDEGNHLEKRAWNPSIYLIDAYLPNAINGLPVTESLYISPKPFGPIIEGRDVFEDAIRAVYEKAGFEVKFVDDWVFHKASGDIHCATNTRREITSPWWKELAEPPLSMKLIGSYDIYASIASHNQSWQIPEACARPPRLTSILSGKVLQFGNFFLEPVEQRQAADNRGAVLKLARQSRR